MRKVLILLLALTVDVSAFAAARKDFKGLFGSYRREKFTENEGNSSDFGIDIMLSTLLPVTSVVKSQETLGGAFNSLNYSSFFNVEAGVHLSLAYHWQLFANVGLYNYETRKENIKSGTQNPELPLFHQFEMTVVPLVAGFKYRFSTEDIVPYVGVGAGISYVRRKGFYDYSAVTFNEEYLTALTAEAIGGVEFYFSSRAGIRLEISAFFLKLPEKPFNSGGSAENFPIFQYQGNVWSVRYASGLFFLF